MALERAAVEVEAMALVGVAVVLRVESPAGFLAVDHGPAQPAHVLAEVDVEARPGRGHGHGRTWRTPRTAPFRGTSPRPASRPVPFFAPLATGSGQANFLLRRCREQHVVKRGLPACSPACAPARARPAGRLPRIPRPSSPGIVCLPHRSFSLKRLENSSTCHTSLRASPGGDICSRHICVRRSELP